MTKELQVAIMERSRLRNKFLREKNQPNRDTYKLQRNFCKKLLRKTKNSYFSNLDTKKITDNRTFWKTIVPLFTNKPSKSENIIINDGDKRISDEKKLCQIFNTFFSNVVQLRYPSNYFNDILFHSLSAIIEHFEKHPSVTNIKNKRKEISLTFSYYGTF